MRDASFLFSDSVYNVPMKTLLISTLFVINTVLASEVGLKKIPDTKSITSKFSAEKMTVLGKEWSGSEFCNEDAIDNPETFEAYTTGHAEYEIATLCPGSLDGTMNVVSVFSKTKSPKSKKVSPLSSSSRITDEVLNKTVQGLLTK